MPPPKKAPDLRKQHINNPIMFTSSYNTPHPGSMVPSSMSQTRGVTQGSCSWTVFVWNKFSSMGLSTWVLHETGFTGCGFPIRIQCGLTWASHSTQTTCIAVLDWLSLTVLEHCHTVRIQIEVVWRQSDLWVWIPDWHRIWIQGLVWRALIIVIFPLGWWVVIRLCTQTRWLTLTI